MAERSEKVEVGKGPSKPRRSFARRLLVRVVVFVGLFYVAWCATLYFVQDNLIFLADKAPQPQPLLYSATTEEIERLVENGDRAVAWFVPATTLPANGKGPAVVFFHGNAEIIDYKDDMIAGFRRLGLSVLLPEFRGYGRSSGKPSEDAIVSDAVYFYDWLKERPDVDRDRIVIHGCSLGGGVAGQLAARRRPAVLVLESTFTSLAAMARRLYAPMFLAKHPFRTDRVLESLDVPVLIMHGMRDDVIPVSHARKLRSIASDATYVEYDCAHNDFPGTQNEEAYWVAIESFLVRGGVLAGESK